MQDNFKYKLEFIEDLVEALEKENQRCHGAIEAINDDVRQYEKELKTLKYKQDLNEKCIIVLDLAQTAVTDKIRKGFESIITYALQFILGIGSSFKLEFKKRGSLQEVNFNIITKDLPDYADPIDTEAGGILDIVSLVLRVAILELHKPRIEGPIILDEPMKHLSRQHLERASGFLTKLAEKTNRQIIMVSHKDEFTASAGKVVQVK